MKVLIGEISSYKAIVIASFLKKTYKEIFIVTYDYSPLAKYVHTKFSDKHILVLNPSLDEYISNLSLLCKNETIDLFLPVHSNYIGEIIKKRDLFGRCFSYCGDFESYILLHDKLNLYSIATKLEIRVPINYHNIESAVIPFVAKPKNKSAAKGVYYINTEKDKENLLRVPSSDYLYQSFIKGTGCGYSLFAREGKILIGYGHIRLGEYPVSGGSSIYRAGYFVEEMKTIADLLLSEVKWSGFAMLEFKITPQNDLILIEVNPRIWGSINQGLQNGVNYFKYLIPYDYQKHVEKKEKFTYLSPQIYLSFVHYILNGNLKPIKQYYLNLSRNAPDISLTRDFKGWFSVLIRSLHL